MAATAAPQSPRDAEFVTIERQVREVAVAPGTTSSEEVVVKNQTSRAIVVDANVMDLGTRRGGARSLRLEEAGTQPRGAGAWLHVSSKPLRIPAMSQDTLRVSIDVPASAEPGGWYAALVLEVTPESGGGVVALRQEASVTMLLTVAGRARRDLRVALAADARVRLRGGTATWFVDVENRGAVHESYGGRVVVDAALAGRRSLQLRPGILLPGERRRQRVQLELREAPDIVAARAEVRSRGRAGDARQASDLVLRADAPDVYVLPWWIPVVLLVGVAAVVLRIRARRKWRHDVDPDFIE